MWNRSLLSAHRYPTSYMKAAMAHNMAGQSRRMRCEPCALLMEEINQQNYDIYYLFSFRESTATLRILHPGEGTVSLTSLM